MTILSQSSQEINKQPPPTWWAQTHDVPPSVPKCNIAELPYYSWFSFYRSFGPLHFCNFFSLGCEWVAQTLSFLDLERNPPMWGILVFNSVISHLILGLLYTTEACRYAMRNYRNPAYNVYVRWDGRASTEARWSNL